MQTHQEDGAKGVNPHSSMLIYLYIHEITRVNRVNFPFTARMKEINATLKQLKHCSDHKCIGCCDLEKNQGREFHYYAMHISTWLIPYFH